MRYPWSIVRFVQVSDTLKQRDAMNQTPEQIAFRAKLWKEFVASYQAVLADSPETFSDYCAKFRERWVNGC